MNTLNINQDDYNYLYKNYNWFAEKFPKAIQDSCDEFFLKGFRLTLLGISKNINPLMEKESYFVTKIMIDKFRDIYFRASEKTIEIILDKVLGRTPKRFNLNKLSDLEAKIITSFNDYLYNSIKSNITEAPPTVKRLNFDVIHLTFLLSEENGYGAGKLIITLPKELISPESINSTGEKFANTDFSTSYIDVKIKIGTTKFSVFDLKALDIDDIVVFEQSSTNKLTMFYNEYEKEININPNPGLVLPVKDNEEGEKMSADNLWDSIEVEMDAQFDSVKISLGELKQIETGQVVDLTAIYDNNVTLSVENKPIATGELVIVNDRYGVKIKEVIARKNKDANVAQNNDTDNLNDLEEDFSPIENNENDDNVTSPIADNEEAIVGGGDDEDFDYSDFELEDEDI